MRAELYIIHIAKMSLILVSLLHFGSISVASGSRIRRIGRKRPYRLRHITLIHWVVCLASSFSFSLTHSCTSVAACGGQPARLNNLFKFNRCDAMRAEKAHRCCQRACVLHGPTGRDQHQATAAAAMAAAASMRALAHRIIYFNK